MNFLARHARRCSMSTRQIHNSPSASFPRRVITGVPPPPLLAKTGALADEEPGVDDEDERDMPYEEMEDHGSTSLGHIYLEEQRQMLYYMRLIEHDIPKLVKYREPFVPPSDDRPLVVRAIDYSGEEHPATAKRSMVVPVAKLPLNGQQARHAIKLLAGPRWTPMAPAGSGIGRHEGSDEQGFIKISCEDYPEPGMNLKWISDVLDRLIKEANANGPKYSEIPVDMRHIEAKKRKAKKGDNHGTPRPSINDFPQHWLPHTPMVSS